jgi:hypothetical protein
MYYGRAYSTLNIVSLARGAIVELGDNKLFESLFQSVIGFDTFDSHIDCEFSSLSIHFKMDIDNTKKWSL